MISLTSQSRRLTLLINLCHQKQAQQELELFSSFFGNKKLSYFKDSVKFCHEAGHPCISLPMMSQMNYANKHTKGFAYLRRNLKKGKQINVRQIFKNFLPNTTQLTKPAYQNSWRFLIIIVLVIGVFFRFVNLDRKVYWEDEVFTSLRISGYKWTEVVQQAFDNHVINTEDLQKYQRPNLEKTWIDTVKSLAIEDSHHPPLYYLIGRFWVQLLGYSVGAIRSLSALLSLLAFPCIYWLCMLLNTSSR